MTCLPRVFPLALSLLVSATALAAPQEPEPPAPPGPAAEVSPEASPEAAVPEAAPPEEATSPETAPEPTPTVPAAPEPLADAGDDGCTELCTDAAADLSYRRCVALVAAGRSDRVRACFEEVIEGAPRSTAALRARASLTLLEAQAQVPEKEPFIKPGRLELSGVAGLFGVWNGIATGVIIGNDPALTNAPPEALILGTGGLAIALGVGYGVGGYYLAESLELNEADSRLVASGLVWGTSYGIAAVPVMLDLFQPQDQRSVQLSIATVVAGGFLGGAATLAIGRLTKLDTPEVSIINTGGWVGSAIGLLTIPVLAAYQVEPASWYSLSYVIFGTAGLAGGTAMSQIIELTWGETLLADLGAVLGGVAGGTITLALLAGGAYEGLPAGEMSIAITAPIATGLVLGLVGSTAGLTFWRDARGEPLFQWEVEGVDARVTTTAVLDKNNRVVAMPAVVGRF